MRRKTRSSPRDSEIRNSAKFCGTAELKAERTGAKVAMGCTFLPRVLSADSGGKFTWSCGAACQAAADCQLDGQSARLWEQPRRISCPTFQFFFHGRSVGIVIYFCALSPVA